MAKPRAVPLPSAELGDADFGDARLTNRLLRFADAVSSAPGDSLPRAMGAEKELEGVYRFLGNERVTLEAILAPHVDATVRRAADEGDLAVHDTTGFAFRAGGHRIGLGYLQRGGRSQSQEGFFGHFTLAVSGDGSRCPLGLLGLRTHVRKEDASEKPKTSRPYTWRANKESARWVAQALEVQKKVPRAIHVMDREADSYANFRDLLRAGARFVIRGKTGWDRKVTSDGIRGTIPSLASQKPVILRRSVRLSRRAPDRVRVFNKANPARTERLARLMIRAMSVELQRPVYYKRRNSTDVPLTLNAVLVDETNVPAGVAPVSWLLLTNEPIATRAHVEKIVDAYRARWVIEEFFKALKTGCSFEKRQLESLAALRKALGVFSVVAWRLILLRTFAQHAPDAPAKAVVTREQLAVLQSLKSLQHSRVSSVELPKNAAAIDVLRAVARLGGHLESNGPPGWQVLGRGYDALLLLELGWRARAEM